MTKKQKTDAKRTMLPHSKAKLDYYQSYIKRYLPVLRLASFTRSVNIFDVFCGTGIYEDGTKGSPVLAFEAIKDSEEQHSDKALTPVNLIINDIEAKKIGGIKNYLEPKNNSTCRIIYENLDANDFLDKVVKVIDNQKTDERNLILIDPYGYKNIKKEDIKKLLSKKRNTEIILFLPISQIYRFTGKVISEDDTKVKALKDFIESFFPDKTHPIYDNNMTHEKELIEYVRVALTFQGDFFATSYYIQRDQREHYYALFSIMPNIYGLQKNLEVKWELNEESGEGFEQPKQMQDMFGDHFKEQAKREKYNKLKSLLLHFIEQQGKIDNVQLYKFTLLNKFLPKHSNAVLKQLEKDKVIEVNGVLKNRKACCGAFYQNYPNYRDKIVKITITKRN